VTPGEREEVEKEIRAIQEELGIVPGEDADEPPSDLAASYDRISDLYHRRKHLIARLATNGGELCSEGAARYNGLERRHVERRGSADRRRMDRTARRGQA
jgi:hypothetical protein